MNRIRIFIPPAFVMLWATGFIGARYAMPWTEPFQFLAVRFAIAFLLLGGIIVFLRSPRFRSTQILHAAFAGCLLHGVYLGGVFWAIRYGLPSGLSALIVGLQPLITAFMAAILLGERVSRRQWIGLLVGLAGVAMVLEPAFRINPGQVTLATVSAAVIAVIGMSAGTIWQKRYVSGLDLLSGTLYQYLGAAIMLTIMAVMFEKPHVIWTGELVFAMIWLVLVLSIGAILLLMILIREGEVSKVASLFYLVPGVTAVLAWILFDEALNAVQISGMAVAAFGVAFATRNPAPTENAR